MYQKMFVSFVFGILLSFCSSVYSISHEQLQAVKSDGSSVYDESNPLVFPLVVEGVVLNRPGELLDPSADYSYDASMPPDLGGQYQIFFQGLLSDHAGSAVWIGQNYGNLPFIADPDASYTNEEWIAELSKFNPDPNTPYHFAPGDVVRVSGGGLFYKGKFNINERHDKSNDVTIELLERGGGLPRAEVVSLSELKDEYDEFIFDSTRQSGPEYYQSRLVRINNVSFVDPENWGVNGELTVTDSAGRSILVKLGLGEGFYEGSNNLNEVFDLIGILDQESLDYTGGYYIWVPDYDHNGYVLTDRGDFCNSVTGDLNVDGKVDLSDYVILCDGWLLDWE